MKTPPAAWSLRTRSLVLALVGVLAGSLLAVPPADAERGARAPQVLHRVVWDEHVTGRNGIHLMSANTDGTDVRRILSLPRGFTINLTLDRAGRRVAFAPCCRDSFPTLVVVPVTGGKVLHPLARHREIVFVGGIGWSPDGTRVAFEGVVRRGQKATGAIFTVRPDGSGLRKVLTLPETDQPFINDALAWTRAGILYSDGADVRVTSHGRSRTLIRHAYAVSISGNGRYLLTGRSRSDSDRGSLWRSRPDGTHATRVLTYPDTVAHQVFLRDPVLNFSGQRLLIYRETYDEAAHEPVVDVLDWQVGQPISTAEPVPVVGDNYVFTWN